MSRGNSVRGSPERDHYLLYEMLPPKFRRMLQLAHVDLKAEWLLDLLLKFGEEAAYEVSRNSIWQMRRRDLAQDWRPVHPELRR